MTELAMDTTNNPKLTTPGDIFATASDLEESDFEILESKAKKGGSTKETVLDSTMRMKSTSSNNLLDSDNCPLGLQDVSGSDDAMEAEATKRPTIQAFVQFSFSENDQDSSTAGTPSSGSSSNFAKFCDKYLPFLRQVVKK